MVPPPMRASSELCGLRVGVVAGCTYYVKRARDSLSCVALSLPLSLASCLVGLRAPVPSVGDLQVSPTGGCNVTAA